MQSIILLIISIMLVIVSAWNLSIYVRLSDASLNYQTNGQFNTACNVSKQYVNVGKTLSIVILCFSVILMFSSSYNIYYNYCVSEIFLKFIVNKIYTDFPLRCIIVQFDFGKFLFSSL